MFCLLHSCNIPSEKGSTLKGKKLLPMGAASFLLEQTLFQKGGKITDRVVCLESVSISLNISY